MTAPSPRRGSEGRETPSDIDLPGTKYRVVGPLGRGGMGLVYEVEHRNEGSRWAAKVLAHELSDRRDLVKRLHFEAEVLGQLRHPNLVRVVDAGTSANGRVFYVMELLRGKTLREALLDVVAYAPAAACRLMLQLLAGLGAAHEAGLIHRDIKPENVFLCEGGLVKLLDFGIAKNVYAMPAGAPLTPVSGPGVVGTLRYAAPECIEGKRATLLSDIYSVGAVFWELLTGRLPFNVESRFQMFSAIVHQGLPPLGKVRPGLPADLCALVGRAAALDPGARFDSVTTFTDATRRSLEQLPDEPEPAPRPRVRAAPDALQNDTEVDLFAPTMTPPPSPELSPDSSAPAGEARAGERQSKPPESRGRLLLERLQPRQADKVFLDVEELARRNPDWAEALLDSGAPGDDAGDGGEQR